MKKLLGTMALAAAMMVSPTVAEAQFSCDNVFYMSGLTQVGADQCKLFDGPPNQNDDATTVNSWLASLLIGGTYAQVDKANGVGDLLPPLTASNYGNTGTLYLDPAVSGPFVIALKASVDMALFYFDGTHTNIGQLEYSTAGFTTNSGQQPGLSHATLYCANGRCGSTTVPEPASLALLATGMVGLVGIARRRRA